MKDENAFMSPDQVQRVLDSSPFIRFLQLSCERIDADGGRLSLSMPVRTELERIGGTGQFHGGPIAALLDAAGCFGVMMKTGGSVPTINFRVDYLRPAGGARLVGDALVRRVGRAVGVVDVDVFDDQGRLTAVGRGCFGTSIGS